MNADERTPGQQGYGEQSPQQAGRNQSDQQQGKQQGGASATGQASYGNSGEAGSPTLSQNSSSLGQDSDIGQSEQNSGAEHSEQGRDTRLFSGSSNDTGGSVGTGRSGIEGSLDSSDQSGNGMGSGSVGTGRSEVEGSLDNAAQSGEASTGSSSQNFANQGQGAMNQDPNGSGNDSGTTDIEVERSQGRETDIEGSSL